jgi:hypothetical protein
MSHHLDTPLAAQTGQLYLDDLYVFPGQDSTVFIMDVNSNVNGLHSEPGFHPEARYEFKVHFDAADFESLTYRVSFGEPDADGTQALRLHALAGDQAREDSAAGELVLAGRTGETASGSGTRLWARPGPAGRHRLRDPALPAQDRPDAAGRPPGGLRSDSRGADR